MSVYDAVKKDDEFIKYMAMEKTFQPHDIEKHWYKTWEERGYFQPSESDDSYCIMIPPPNVTGSLHMGHAFQDTIMDTLIRYQRMLGKDTLWQVGTDHAGIATQMVVERQLAAQNLTRKELGREAFLEKVWEWKGESGGTITQQLRRLGASVDWDNERFTMDEGLSAAVQTVFIQLYEEGLIYRGHRLVNWDPKLHTAISDLEVESEEEDGFLWHFKYPLTDKNEYLTIATTRPETLLGDTAVAVNPSDERYLDLVGKTITLPLVGRQIPIISDNYVDPEFGTGCVKITPAHDFNDYDVGKRHQLPMINIFTIDATINDQAPTEYQGLDRFDARKKVVEDMKALGLLEKVEPHKLKVPRGDRSGVVIEPYLTKQWYVKAKPLAEPAIEAVESGKIEFVPKQWENTYFAWMRDIQDWCISRQLWWGHRIPAWYDEQGNAYVGENEAAVREKYSLSPDTSLQQDEDVLDTWFSSALWTFSTLGWPHNTEKLKRYHSTDVLVTGFDIIFFWVARMIMMTLKFVGEVPFKQVYVTGLVRDGEGQKMSKSKGNVLDPLDIIDGIDLNTLIEKRTKGLMQPEKAQKIEAATRKHFPEGIASYGTDALRFTMLSLASTGRDIKFDINRLEGYRNFCNKLWNAARMVLMNTEGHDCGIDGEPKTLGLPDQWILSSFERTRQSYTESLENYRFDLASQTVYEFIWNEYCDWYLELSKPILWDETLPIERIRGTRFTLISILEKTLRLLHPMMPYITESIWQSVAPLAGKNNVDSIMLSSFPNQEPQYINESAEADIQWLKGVITGIRNIRGEMNISPGKPLTVLLNRGNQEDKIRLENNDNFLKKLAKLDEIQWLDKNDSAPMSATQLVGEMEVLVPMAGLIDKDSELKRLSKEIDKLSKEINRLNGKLGNEKFIAKAPKDVVEKEKVKLQEYQQSEKTLKDQFLKIESL